MVGFSKKLRGGSCLEQDLPKVQKPVFAPAPPCLTCQSKFLLGSQKLIFRFLSMPLLGLSAPQARTVQSCEFHSPSYFTKCAAGSFFQNDSFIIRDHRERSRRPRISCFRACCARQKNSESLILWKNRSIKCLVCEVSVLTPNLRRFLRILPVETQRFVKICVSCSKSSR